MLKNKNCNISIYEPLLKGESFYECKLEDNLNEFKAKADLIISNRIDDQILELRLDPKKTDLINIERTFNTNERAIDHVKAKVFFIEALL